jgi:hypothetical protein
MSFVRFAIRPDSKDSNSRLLVGIDSGGLLKEGHLYEISDYWGLGEHTIKDLGKSVATLRYEKCLDNSKKLPDILDKSDIANWAWNVERIIMSGDHLYTPVEYMKKIVDMQVKRIQAGGSPDEIPESVREDILTLAGLIKK